MNRFITTFLGLGRVLLAATAATTVSAQEYSIDWFTITGGGGTSTNGGYSLSGTIDQPVAGATMTGGGYTLDSGFWRIPPERLDVLYVSSPGNHTIRKFAPDGVGDIFASSGLSGPSGLAFDGAGNLFVANFNNNTILKFTANGTGSVFATTGLSGPNGLAFDRAGNLYAANHFNDTIQKFTPDGAGSLFAANGLSVPQGLAFDSAGNLYVANASNATIRKITADGTGSLFASVNSYPQGLAFDGTGNLYVACRNAGTIQKITPGGGVSLFANTGPNPAGLAFDEAGNLYVTTAANNSIQKFAANGVATTFASSGLNLPAYLAFPTLPLAPVAPRIISVEKIGHDLRLSFTSVSGQRYAIQNRADLASGEWTTIQGTTNVGTGGLQQQTLTNGLSAAQQFYRIHASP